MNSWQTMAALLCVAWAAGYVLWRCRQALGQPQGGSCAGCSHSQTGLQQNSLVPIDVLLEQDDREAP